uniref:Uncharacterized protein n=1 Tax=Opuntia streptacantha TaxID=393608 RepID=A0A7C9DZ97_OPUST
MDSEVGQVSSPQPHVEQERDCQSESHGVRIQPIIEMGQVIQNLKQLKSSEILGSAVTTFTSNFKFMFLMILSILPLCAFMIFYEIKLQRTIEGVSNFLDSSSFVGFHSISYDQYDNANESEWSFFLDIVQLCLFYSVFYPILEIYSVFITINLAAKIHSGQPGVTEKAVLDHNNLAGIFSTYLYIQLLSALTFLGLFWVAVNYYLFSIRFSYSYDFLEFYSNILSTGFHSAVSVALLYKYLGWSAFWNMGMVISVLEEETGIGAFGLSAYYGKHCKQNGIQLMLIFFAFCNSPRLLSLSFGLCNSSFAGVCVTVIVIGLFCLGNLVKWVAFVLYFYGCKQQVMEKKVDGGGRQICEESC